MQWIVGLNSLRLFAMLLIVIYHFFGSFLPGGFIAVEIFFAISGFLIVSGLAKEYLGTGKISYRAFIKNRFARLFPPLLLLVSIVLALSLLVDSDVLAGLGPRTLAALTFSTNIFELASNGGYENFISPNLFRHTWFLALEMQIYLIMPLILKLIVNLRTRRRDGMKLAAVIFATLGALSVVLMAIYGGLFNAVDRAYFALDTHVAAFCFGASLGIVNRLHPIKKLHRKALPIAEIITIFVTFAILARNINYTSPLTFYLVLPLAAILSAILIYYVLQIQGNKRHGRTVRLAEYLGGKTYGIYLFHYPLFLLAGYILPVDAPVWLCPSVALLGSIVFTWLCDFLIRDVKKIAILYRKHCLEQKQKIAIGIYAVLAIVVVLGGVIRVSTVPAESNIAKQLAGQKTEAEQSKIQTFNLGNFISDATTIVGTALTVAETAAPAYTPVIPPQSTATVTADTKVLLIGDSVMLGAKNNLEAKIPHSYVDAMESRGIEKATSIISDIRSRGLLPEIIVIALATNYRNITPAMLDNIMSAAGPNHKFILVTAYAGPTQPRETQNATMKNYADAHSNVWLVDWYSIAIRDSSLLYNDRIHLDFAGRETYANLIANKIKEIQ